MTFIVTALQRANAEKRDIIQFFVTRLGKSRAVASKLVFEILQAIQDPVFDPFRYNPDY
jgi:hypothetical protein